MRRMVAVSFNEKWYKQFLQKTGCKMAPTESEVTNTLINIYQKAVISLAQNLEEIPFKLSQLKGVRMNPTEDTYTIEIPEQEFGLLNDALIHSIPLLKTEKDKKRVRRLANDLLSDDKNVNRFFSLLLIVLGLKSEPIASICFADAKGNLEQFVRDVPLNMKSPKNTHNNRARDIRRIVMKEIKDKNSLSKEMKKAMLSYIKETYPNYKRLNDEQLLAHLLADSQKKVDELLPNNERPLTNRCPIMKSSSSDDSSKPG